MPGEISRSYQGPKDGGVPAFMCDHPEADLRDGPRVPMRWGSGPTQVCSLCGSWRNTLHTPGPWLRPPIRTEADADT
jgi:hypothetical protein